MNQEIPYTLSCIFYFDYIIDFFIDQYIFYSIDDNFI